MSNIAGVYYNDTAAAPGMCVSVYFSGCPFHCPGCHNPEAQDYSYGEPYTEKYKQKIIDSLNKNGVPRKLCILGGEPLCDENLEAVYDLMLSVKENDLTVPIYIWTGYTFEQLLERSNQSITLQKIFSLTYCIIDGLYEEDKRDVTLHMRGSSNQRIIHLVNI